MRARKRLWKQFEKGVLTRVNRRKEGQLQARNANSAEKRVTHTVSITENSCGLRGWKSGRVSIIRAAEDRIMTDTICE